MLGEEVIFSHVQIAQGRKVKKLQIKSCIITSKQSEGWGRRKKALEERTALVCWFSLIMRVLTLYKALIDRSQWVEWRSIVLQAGVFVHKWAPNQLIDQFYTQLLSVHRLTKTSLDILIRVPAGTNQNVWLDVFWAKERPWNYATSLLQSTT